jgi:hypothetical protein
MRTYDDLAPRSPTAPPSVPGFYAWWQIPGALPGVPGTPHPLARLELLYVGVAPRDAESRSHLRRRLGNHHRAPVGSSTFRLDLAAFLWEPMAWTPFWTDRPTLPEEQLAQLRTWQREQLHVQWIETTEPWRLECEVIRAMAPPLNRDHNADHPFYAEVGRARERFRGAARMLKDPAE